MGLAVATCLMEWDERTGWSKQISMWIQRYRKKGGGTLPVVTENRLDCIAFVDPTVESNQIGEDTYQNMGGEEAVMEMREASWETAPARPGFLQLWRRAGSQRRQNIWR